MNISLSILADHILKFFFNNNNNNNNSDTHKELVSTELPFIVKGNEKIECNNHVNTQTFF